MNTENTYLFTHGLSDEQYNIGLSYIQKNKDDKECVLYAKRWFYQAANQGHTEAMFHLGVLLENEGDHHLALPWYFNAAAKGHSGATYNIAMMFCSVDKDEHKKTKEEMAVHWMQKAADLNFPQALNNLGCMWRSGYGGLQMSLEKAKFYFQKAAALGIEEAKSNLARLRQKAYKNPLWL